MDRLPGNGRVQRMSRERSRSHDHSTRWHRVSRQPVHGLEPGRIDAESRGARCDEQRRERPRPHGRAGRLMDRLGIRVRCASGTAVVRARDVRWDLDEPRRDRNGSQRVPVQCNGGHQGHRHGPERGPRRSGHGGHQHDEHHGDHAGSRHADGDCEREFRLRGVHQPGERSRKSAGRTPSSCQRRHDNGTNFYTFTTPPRPPTAPASPEWPTFQNNPPRQGVSPSVFLPPLTLRWSAGPYQNSQWSSPIFADATLFETTWDGHLRARDPYSGTIQWDRKLGVSGARTGTPSFDNGVLYAAFAGQSSDQLYALDATTGDTLWVVDRGVGGDVNPDLPLLATDGLVFGLAFSGEIFAIDEATGTLAWSYQSGDLPWGGV